VPCNRSDTQGVFSGVLSDLVSRANRPARRALGTPESAHAAPVRGSTDGLVIVDRPTRLVGAFSATTGFPVIICDRNTRGFFVGERAGRIALSGIEFVRRARRSVPANGPRMNASDHVRTSGLTTTLENQVLVTLLRQNYPCHSRCATCSPDSNRRRPDMVTKDP
jgi:hypothetical protein